MTEKEKKERVGNGFLTCMESFSIFEKGKSYWLEYHGKDNYYGRSDNILNKKVHITPDELLDKFARRVMK